VSLILRATADLLRVTTTVGGSNIECHVSFVDILDSAAPPVVQFVDVVNTANITTVTTTTILDCTTANHARRVLYASAKNNHASVTETVEFVHSDGTTVRSLIKATLLAGEALIYNGVGTWLHYDTNGALYPSVGNSATQAEMEAGTATNKYVTPQGVKWHPGVAKFWLRGDTAAGLTSNWNVTSLTDTGTGVMGVTIATDFSSATGWSCQVSVEATATTWAVANTRECHIRNATLAAGTVSVDCVDNTATTSLVKDPSSWHVVGYGDQA
jgi:hypothetical protein